MHKGKPETDGRGLPVLPRAVYSLIELALDEDIGRGDCTTEAVIPEGTRAHAVVRLKQPARVAGLPVVEAVFRAVDPA
ncbi:MAG: hypothetical protein K6T30_10055, partial [Alicyclobacillus sp.]|nr:hypothetical protein [Alicyclobacillus sp.]